MARHTHLVQCQLLDLTIVYFNERRIYQGTVSDFACFPHTRTSNAPKQHV